MSDLAEEPARASFERSRCCRPSVKWILRWVEHLLAVIGACFVVYRAGFELTAMTSGSMAPTLRGDSYEDGDRILLEKVTSWFRKPQRWEVYFFYNSDGTPVAKRIVGLPGEKVSIIDNQVCINGVAAHRPVGLGFLKYYAFGNLTGGKQVSCNDGYFVLGDDSRDSYDSRFVGPVPGHEFRGRVWCIVWPFARAGFVR